MLNWTNGMFTGDRVVYELNERGYTSLVYFVGEDYDTKLWHAFNKGEALGREFTSAEQAIEFCENHSKSVAKVEDNEYVSCPECGADGTDIAIDYHLVYTENRCRNCGHTFNGKVTI